MCVRLTSHQPVACTWHYGIWHADVRSATDTIKYLINMAALHFQFMLQKVLPCRKYITYVELNNIVRIIKENADLCTGLWTCSQFDVFLRYARKIIKLCESCFISSNVCLLDINNKIYSTSLWSYQEVSSAFSKESGAIKFLSLSFRESQSSWHNVNHAITIWPIKRWEESCACDVH